MPAYVAVLFDGEHENSRTALGAGYKANRADYSKMPEVTTKEVLKGIGL